MKNLSWLALVAASFAIAAPGAVAKPHELRIETIGHFTGPNSAEGTWSATGVVTDGGTYTESFRIEGDRIIVEKLLDGRAGGFALRGWGVVKWLDDCTATFESGYFRIEDGTGDYAKLNGHGKPAAEPGSVGDICTGAIDVVHVAHANLAGDGRALQGATRLPDARPCIGKVRKSHTVPLAGCKQPRGALHGSCTRAVLSARITWMRPCGDREAGL